MREKLCHLVVERPNLERKWHLSIWMMTTTLLEMNRWWIRKQSLRNNWTRCLLAVNSVKMRNTATFPAMASTSICHSNSAVVGLLHWYDSSRNCEIIWVLTNYNRHMERTVSPFRHRHAMNCLHSFMALEERERNNLLHWPPWHHLRCSCLLWILTCSLLHGFRRHQWLHMATCLQHSIRFP